MKMERGLLCQNLTEATGRKKIILSMQAVSFMQGLLSEMNYTIFILIFWMRQKKRIFRIQNTNVILMC